MLSYIERRIYKVLQRLEDIDDQILFGCEEYTYDERLIIEESLDRDLDLLCVSHYHLKYIHSNLENLPSYLELEGIYQLTG